MEFQVCFTLAKYEHDMLSLCEATSVFIGAFCNSKIHFHQLGPFELIKPILKSLNVCKVYLQCGIIIQWVVTIHGLPSVQLSPRINLKIEFVKINCLGTIWSTKMISIV